MRAELCAGTHLQISLPFCFVYYFDLFVRLAKLAILSVSALSAVTDAGLVLINNQISQSGMLVHLIGLLLRHVYCLCDVSLF